MAEKVLLGGICPGIRKLTKPDSITVQANPGRCSLFVVELGDTRQLQISKKVAEVLIAWGITYGD